MRSIGPVTVLPYSPIGAPAIDALGERCHAFYSAIFSGDVGKALPYLSKNDFHIIESPTTPYTQSVFDGVLGTLSVGVQQSQYVIPNNLIIRVFTLGERHCVANGVDEKAKLVDNPLGTFRFEFLDHSYWLDGFIKSSKPYVYNTYPIMRGQMVKKGARRYVQWKDADDKARERDIAAFDATHPNYDPRVQ